MADGLAEHETPPHRNAVVLNVTPGGLGRQWKSPTGRNPILDGVRPKIGYSSTPRRLGIDPHELRHPLLGNPTAQPGRLPRPLPFSASPNQGGAEHRQRMRWTYWLPVLGLHSRASRWA
jgi:hypothetical protein